jgi:type IV secretion system protein VirB9
MTRPDVLRSAALAVVWISPVAALPLVAVAAPASLQVPGGAKTYDYQNEVVYPVIATPGRITDIVLEPGEALVGSGPVAAGDTARWVIGDTISGAGAARRVHVMVKPTAPDLATNLIINTDRRTYHLELRASGRTWLSQVAWRYGEGRSAAAPVLIGAPPVTTPPLAPAAVEARAPVVLNRAYRIEGPHPAWRPVEVYDDGRKVFVVFGAAIDMADLPPLYRLGPDGKTAELINFHVEGRALVAERLFDRAELRFGAKRRAQAVRLVRLNPIAEAVR